MKKQCLMIVLLLLMGCTNKPLEENSPDYFTESTVCQYKDTDKTVFPSGDDEKFKVVLVDEYLKEYPGLYVIVGGGYSKFWDAFTLASISFAIVECHKNEIAPITVLDREINNPLYVVSYDIIKKAEWEAFYSKHDGNKPYMIAELNDYYIFSTTGQIPGLPDIMEYEANACTNDACRNIIENYNRVYDDFSYQTYPFGMKIIKEFIYEE